MEVNYFLLFFPSILKFHCVDGFSELSNAVRFEYILASFIKFEVWTARHTDEIDFNGISAIYKESSAFSSSLEDFIAENVSHFVFLLKNEVI